MIDSAARLIRDKIDEFGERVIRSGEVTKAVGKTPDEAFKNKWFKEHYEMGTSSKGNPFIKRKAGASATAPELTLKNGKIEFKDKSVPITQNFNKHLMNLIGPPPNGMIDPHAHHILFKEGNGPAQKALVKEGQEILRKYNIDPIMGKENLVWAPNRIKDQHGIEALRNVVSKLKEVEEAGGDADDIIEMLQKLGNEAARRR